MMKQIKVLIIFLFAISMTIAGCDVVGTVIQEEGSPIRASYSAHRADMEMNQWGKIVLPRLVTGEQLKLREDPPVRRCSCRAYCSQQIQAQCYTMKTMWQDSFGGHGTQGLEYDGASCAGSVALIWRMELIPAKN